MARLLQPIGVRLAERVHNADNSKLEELINNFVYDPAEGINKIKIGNEWVAAISLGDSLDTQTETKEHNETTDRDHHPDYPPAYLATTTFTENEREDSDEDPSLLGSLATQTETRIEGENTDEDEGPGLC